MARAEYSAKNEAVRLVMENGPADAPIWRGPAWRRKLILIRDVLLFHTLFFFDICRKIAAHYIQVLGLVPDEKTKFIEDFEEVNPNGEEGVTEENPSEENSKKDKNGDVPNDMRSLRDMTLKEATIVLLVLGSFLGLFYFNTLDRKNLSPSQLSNTMSPRQCVECLFIFYAGVFLNYELNFIFEHSQNPIIRRIRNWYRDFTRDEKQETAMEDANESSIEEGSSSANDGQSEETIV